MKTNPNGSSQSRPVHGRTPHSQRLAVRAGLLIDGVNPEPVRDATILIEKDRIGQAVAGEGVSMPPDADVIDLFGLYSASGALIDAHTHVCFAPQDGKGSRAYEVGRLSSLAGGGSRAGVITELPDLQPSGTQIRKAPDLPTLPCVTLSISGSHSRLPFVRIDDGNLDHRRAHELEWPCPGNRHAITPGGRHSRR